MNYVSPSRLLRTALAIDAAGSASLALIQILAPYALARLTGVPVELAIATGAVLAAYAALLIWLASGDVAARPLISLIIGGNVAWALACGLIVVFRPLNLTALGAAYLVFQAIATVAFAGAQALGLRRSGPMAPMTVNLALKDTT